MRYLVALLIVLLVQPAHGDGLSGLERRIVAEVDARGEPAIALLKETVDIPSATENLPGVRRAGAKLCEADERVAPAEWRRLRGFIDAASL